MASNVKRSTQSTTEAAKSVNLNAVTSAATSGATNIWKAVTAAAQHIQQVTVATTGADSTLPIETSGNLDILANYVSSKFDETNNDHVQLVQRLWKAMFPTQPYQRTSPIWKQAGFQKNDPVLDVKTSGLLSLYAMAYICEKYPEQTHKMLEKNKANTKNNYPFAVVGVNLTLMLVELFYLRENLYMSTRQRFWNMFHHSDALFEVFAIGFIHIDALWTHRNAVRADFGKIIGETKALLTAVLYRGPQSIQEFKEIAADEGMMTVI